MAKEKKAKVILVDSSNKDIVFNKDMADSIAGRNIQMAKNILNAFQSGECKHGLSIQGTQHLFTRNGSKNLEPIDSILKKEQLNLKDDDKLTIKKAMVYSPSSKNFTDAMGICSWLNIIPKEREAYYSKAVFFQKHEAFPERVRSAMNESYGATPDNDIDYAVILPAQIDKPYLLKKLNEGKVKPKKYKSVETVSIEAKNVPFELRTNGWSMQVTNAQTGLEGLCSNVCMKKGRRSFVVVSNVTYYEPTIECRSFHPSWTGGANFAPIYGLNAKVDGDCYCTSKY